MTILLLLLLAQQPVHDHHAGVDRRGDAVMGFSHEKTTHHFYLTATGGVIDITANDAGDAESAAQIRGHLTHIRQMFSDGDFTAPILIHATNPPGTATMTRLKAEITYSVEEIPSGGRIRIATANADALRAIHEFQRFQITDHRTGDPLTITKQ
jgi:hypothetical protein